MLDLLSIKGIGRNSKEKLIALGIHNCTELVQFFPMKYIEQKINTIDERFLKEELTLSGVLLKKPVIHFIRRKLTKMVLSVQVENEEFQVSIFNREFMAPRLFVNEKLVFSGKFTSRNQFMAYDLQKRSHYIEGILPQYPLEGISSKNYSKWVKYAIENLEISYKETLPKYLLEKRKLLHSTDLLVKIHFPKAMDEVWDATNRIKYEELLDFFLKMQIMKQKRSQIFLHKSKYNIEFVKHFIQSLPFELTEDQKAATNEIFVDMKSSSPMNRLLQGDVGSGKTVVSAIAAYAKMTAHQQVAFMAPTEILAMQHKDTFQKWLSPFNIKIAYLSSSVSGKERSQILSQLESHQIDMIIGTHALIQQDIHFDDLGLIIIDEQHRFGVMQRRQLREKGWHPDVLFMSATPIPRTLAITLFNDMEISSIHQMPSGRKETLSDIISFEEIKKSIQVMKTELEKGHQAYVIAPVIEMNDGTRNISVKEAFDDLREALPSKYCIGMLHGKMKSLEKEEVLNAFYQNKIQVLVSTTVVEVGVHVPNATFMMIMNASSFGLSQLHQLRGRVGRSKDQAYCHFITDVNIEEEQRLQVLKETTDGFKISEADLSFRGPGEIFGMSQTGIPKFRMVNFAKDQALIQEVLEDATKCIYDYDPITQEKLSKIEKQIDTYQND